MSVKPASRNIALAIAAHPDDIEFMMAGTLLLLREKGFEIHCLNVSSGNCGSQTLVAAAVRRIRRKESLEAARILGARDHPGFADDLEILYEVRSLRRLAAVVREVRPSIVLTHSPVDYMEDHMNTCRLAVTAAFARGMPNFVTTPRRAAVEGDVTVYHAMPHGLQDPFGQPVRADFFVNIDRTLATKRAALAAHASQKEWLDASQGMDSYLKAMEDTSREMGRLSGKYAVAEGWRRHSHIGFCAEHSDPLREQLRGCWVNAPRGRQRA